MELFWEVYQSRRIAEARSEAGDAARKASKVQTEISEVRRDVERLSLACQAMWELLRDTVGVSEEDIWKKMEQIDLRDGRKDGKIGSSVLKCESCGRKASSSRRRCIYCGSALTGKKHVFE